MDKLRVVVALPNQDIYQQEQARVARATAQRYGFNLQVLFTDNDVSAQGKQVLEVVRMRGPARPDAILLEPYSGNGFVQVAQMAVSSGIAWVLLNCDADYLADLRRSAQVPLFSVVRDHLEIGRLQGRQLGALLPSGGRVLLVQGPPVNSAAQLRTDGLLSVKSHELRLKQIHSTWSGEDARRSVSEWIAKKEDPASHFQVVACHSDAISRGVRDAFSQVSGPDRERWLALPMLGIDGLPAEGRAWVDDGSLTATISTDVTTGVALQLLADAMNRGSTPPPRTVIPATSYPMLELLRPVRRRT
jgi:ABC-type sugar transport system substrate-binding protein